MELLDVQIEKAIGKSLRRAQRHGDLPAFDIPDQIVVERPQARVDG